MYKKCIKRILDVFVSLLGLLILWPVMLIVAALARIGLGKPVIFKQIRITKNNRKFVIYKFRTMTNEKDENGDLLPDDFRMTRLGRRLRKYHLDELPQLINVFKGDMSIVGPRPLVEAELARCDEYELRRHEVKSGLTGVTQIRKKNPVNFKERCKLDVEYVDNVTFWGDLKIIVKTVFVVLFQ